MKRVILESPYAGNMNLNLMYARMCMRECITKYNEAPLASHLLYTQRFILDDHDPLEREMGIAAGLVWAELAEATIIYEDLGITTGMWKGIEHANYFKRPIVYRKLGVIP